MSEQPRLKSLAMTIIDATPLIEYVQARGGFSAFSKDAHLRRRWEIVRKRGTISVVGADRLCIKGLGVNPAIVFGDAWWDTEDWAAPRRKVV